MFYSAISPTSLFTSATNTVGNLVNDFCTFAKRRYDLVNFRMAHGAYPDDVLYKAVLYRDLAKAKIALTSGANPNLEKKSSLDGRTSILMKIPCYRGHRNDLNMVELLLQHRSSPLKTCDHNDKESLYFDALALYEHEKVFSSILKLFVDYEINPDQQDAQGDTILHEMVKNPDVIDIRTLLEIGADPNIQNNLGETPLHLAIKYVYKTGSGKEKISTLLQNGADPNIQNTFGDTPLHTAIILELIDVVALLLDRKAANPNIKNENGDTPLHKAIRKGQIDIARLLLQNGADPNIKDRFGDTPLHTAICEGHIDAARLLLQNGADPNIKDRFGDTPLHTAICEGHIDAARLLLQNGADPNIPDKYGDIPLHIACSHGHIDAARLLLDNGADPNIKNKYSETPLHIAIDREHIDAAHLLLDKGADPSIQDEDGNTPFHLACKRQPRDVVESLVDFKAKQPLRRDPVSFLRQRELGHHKSYIDSHNFFHFLNQQNAKGQTPLHRAVKAGNEETIEYLLENGAQIPPDADGKTPLDLAADPSILDLFKKHSGWANEAAASYAFEKRNFPALLFILQQRPLLSSELREKILADAQRPGMESIRRLLEGGC